MKRIVFVVVALIGIALIPSVASAQSSETLLVSASVSRNCVISTSPINFPAYDPVKASNEVTANGSVIIACTKGAAPKIGLTLGGAPLGGVRRLTGPTVSGATSYLNYELLQDTDRPWQDTEATRFLYTSLGKAAVTKMVIGRIPAGQDPVEGAYSDTVTATVNF
jgi:spore coat protein U-like protein